EERLDGDLPARAVLEDEDVAALHAPAPAGEDVEDAVLVRPRAVAEHDAAVALVLLERELDRGVADDAAQVLRLGGEPGVMRTVEPADVRPDLARVVGDREAFREEVDEVELEAQVGARQHVVEV